MFLLVDIINRMEEFIAEREAAAKLQQQQQQGQKPQNAALEESAQCRGRRKGRRGKQKGRQWCGRKGKKRQRQKPARHFRFTLLPQPSYQSRFLEVDTSVLLVRHPLPL